MSEGLQWVLGIAGAVVGGYVAIRADLAGLKVRIERAERDIQHLFTKGAKP